MTDSEIPIGEFLKRHGAAAWALRFRPPERDLDDELFGVLNDFEKARARMLSPGARRTEWAEARRLEREVRIAVPSDTLRVSVTHAKGMVLVIGAKELGGIGVDLEPIGRTADSRVLDRITTASEREIEGLNDPLDFWVIKEASFKANPENGGTLISHYRITSFDSVTGEGQVTGPAGEGAFILMEFQRSWKLAVAVVRRKKSV